MATFSLIPVDEAPAAGATFSLVPVEDTPPAAPQQAQPPQQTISTGEDVARSALTGIVKGIPNLIDIGASGVATLADKALGVSDKGWVDTFQQYAGQQNLSKGLDAALGTEEHKSQTKLGEYANLAGQGAATALLGGPTAMNALRGATGGVGAGVGGDVGDKIAGTPGRVVGTVAGAYFGATAPDRISNVAKDGINWLRGSPQAQTALGDVAGGVDDVGRAQEVQKVLKGEYDKVTASEDALWGQVRKESAQSALPVSKAKELTQKLLDAQADMTSNEAAGMVDRQIARINRFVDAGQDIPANEVIGMRKTLSKAAQKDGGLWSAVRNTDDFIADNLDVPTLPKAISASRSRFQVFDDQKAVAAAIADDATPESFGRVLFGGSSPSNAPNAAQYYNQVVKAAGKGGEPKVRQMLDQAVAHRILQVARSNEGDKVWIGKAANEVSNLYRKNPSLWKELSKGTRDQLLQMEKTLRAEGGTGALNKVGELLFGIINRSSSPLGLKTNLSLPSPFAPKTVAELDEVVKAMGQRPESLLSKSPLAPAAVVAPRSTREVSATMPVSDIMPDMGAGATLAESNNTDDSAFTMTETPRPVSQSVITSEEGVRPISYTDTTGHRTVGIGFNMDASAARDIWKRAGIPESFQDVYDGKVALSQDSIDKLYGKTSKGAERAARAVVPQFDKLGENQRAALTSLVFQLGRDGLSKFKRTLSYLTEGNGKAVENSLLSSLLAKQAPARTRRTALMLAYDISHEEADRMLAEQGRIKPNERKYLS